MADSVTFIDLRNITIVLFVITFLVTSYRCFARYTRRLWWHDDSAALFSAISFVVFLVGTIYLSEKSPSPEVRTTGTYILAVGFYTPIWGARISILLTVIRITPWQLQKRILSWLVVFFVLQFAMLTTQMFWVCELTYTGWKEIPGAICLVPPVVPISLVVTTFVSDFILLVAPLMISWGVRVPALRFRLFFIFSMSIATTISSVVHAVLVLVKPGVWEAIFGGVEAAVSIAVCNATVIIPAVLRVLGVGDPFMREDTVDPNYSTRLDIVRMGSTRVELSLPTSGGTATTDSSKSESAIDAKEPPRQCSDDSCVKDIQKHRLTVRTSGGSLGGQKLTNILFPVGGSAISDSSCSPSSIKIDRDIEAEAGRESKG